MPLLEVEGLSVRYGKALVVDAVDFNLEEGDFTALVGPNGAGKTSILRALSRLIPSEGRISLEGEPLPTGAKGVVDAGLIHCPEGRRLFPDSTVEDNLRLGAHRRRHDRDAVEADLDWVLGLFPSLADRSQQRAGTMSGGEQQMLAIARALMARPRVLLLDEPSLGLAVVIKETIVESVLRLKQRGITTLLVEQDVAFAFQCADHTLVLENGEIHRRGPTKELASDPAIRKAYLRVV